MSSMKPLTAAQDALDLPEEALECTSFRFNVDAPVFVPVQPLLVQENEFIQDLHHLWMQETFAWENEPDSCQFAIWFVDHEWQWPHGREYRTLSLFADFSQWETMILQTWTEFRIPGDPVTGQQQLSCSGC